MNDNHDVIVKVGLTADQYISFKNEARNLDLKDSACLRMLVIKFIREVAMKQLSVNRQVDESTETVLRVSAYD